MRKSVFVESVRLLIVLALMSVGFTIGARFGASFFGSILGASIGYVAGGVMGRFLRNTTEQVEARTSELSAGELLAGAFGAVLGGTLGTMVAAPGVALLPGGYGWIALSLSVWIGVYAGFRILLRRSTDLLSLVRLSDEGKQQSEAVASQDAVLVDSSVLVDSRLLKLSRTGFVHRNLLVPAFVLDEVQGLADARDQSVRAKSRAALEALEAIRRDAFLQIHVLEDRVPEYEEVDAKLVALATRLEVPIFTNDEPLARIAELRGVRCLSLQRLSKSLSSVLAPGERVKVEIVKPGQEPGEGVGFLDEGSMVVVADAEDRVGVKVDIRITSSTRTPHGRMFFASLAED